MHLRNCRTPAGGKPRRPAFSRLGLGLLFTPLGALGLALSTAGATGLVVTIVKCYAYAFQTDINALQDTSQVPRVLSRLFYRTVLAGLHFVQPLARMHGHLRGYLVSPRNHRRAFREGIESSTDLPTPPPVNGAIRSARLVFGLSVETRFWSEQQISVEFLLAKLTDWLRLSRSVDLIEIDDGWHADRDLSVAIGRLTWLDLRALVEDHGGGRGRKGAIIGARRALRRAGLLGSAARAPYSPGAPLGA